MDAGVQSQLLALEHVLLDPQTRSNPEWLDRVLADEMVEFGKSGGVYDKAAIIAALAAEVPAPAGAEPTPVGADAGAKGLLGKAAPFLIIVTLALVGIVVWLTTTR